MVHYRLKRTKTSGKGRSKRKSIITERPHREPSKDDLLHYLLMRDRYHSKGLNYSGLPSGSRLNSLADQRYLKRSDFYGEVDGTIGENAFDYIASLKMSSRLDRDFTHDGKRFIMLGAPFRLTPGLGFTAAAACGNMALASLQAKKPLKALINMYHGICGQYLGLLNHSFDCLDMLKEITRQIKSGAAELPTTVLINTILPIFTKWSDDATNPKNTNMLIEYIKNHPSDMSNLQWGESNKPPLHLLDEKMLWAAIEKKHNPSKATQIDLNEYLGPSENPWGPPPMDDFFKKPPPTFSSLPNPKIPSKIPYNATVPERGLGDDTMMLDQGLNMLVKEAFLKGAAENRKGGKKGGFRFDEAELIDMNYPGQF